MLCLIFYCKSRGWGVGGVGGGGGSLFVGNGGELSFPTSICNGRPNYAYKHFKKQEKEGKKREPKLPTIGKAPLPTYAQKHKKEKRRRRMGACLPSSSRWSFRNFKCLCSSSKLSRLVAFEAHVSSFPRFSLVKHSKLQAFQVHTKS